MSSELLSISPPEIEHHYEIFGAAAELWTCNAPEVLIEGPAGTGKTRATLEKIDNLCEQYPGTRVLICRATRVSMTESVLVTLESKVFWTGHPAISGDASRETRHSYQYPNGSTIVVGGLDKPDRLFSTEWDLVYVAEAIEITEDAWEKFGRAMRNRKIPKGAVSGGPIQPGEEQAVERDPETGIETLAFFTQRIADCNPGAPGHWLNQRPSRSGGRMVRLKSRHADNPSMTAGELAELRAMSGPRRVRLYEGRWTSSDGSVYPEFEESRHVVEPFAIPSEWPQYLGLDPGYDHPCAILWFAVAPNETVYVIDELYRGGLSVQQHATDIRARNTGRTVRTYYADPQHAFSKTAQSPKSIADQLRECGLIFQPWPRSVDVESMVNAVRSRLTSDRLQVFANCTNTIREFQSWSYKRTSTGELPAGDDQFEDKDNHAMDVIKGVIATNPTFTSPVCQVHSE